MYKPRMECQGRRPFYGFRKLLPQQKIGMAYAAMAVFPTLTIQDLSWPRFHAQRMTPNAGHWNQESADNYTDQRCDRHSTFCPSATSMCETHLLLTTWSKPSVLSSREGCVKSTSSGWAYTEWEPQRRSRRRSAVLPVEESYVQHAAMMSPCRLCFMLVRSTRFIHRSLPSPATISDLLLRLLRSTAATGVGVGLLSQRPWGLTRQ